MSVNTGWNKLNKSMQTLREKWDASADEWRDQVRQEFGREHVEPLGIDVSTTLRGMKQIEEVLNRIHRECGETREL